jgi:hypothetical protein
MGTGRLVFTGTGQFCGAGNGCGSHCLLSTLSGRFWAEFYGDGSILLAGAMNAAGMNPRTLGLFGTGPTRKSERIKNPNVKRNAVGGSNS